MPHLQKALRKAKPSKAGPYKPVQLKKSNLVDQLFNAYANKSSRMIDPQGMETLCFDLGINIHTDIRILMLAWKMEAKTRGYFTSHEWHKALTELRADSIYMLKMSLVELEKEVNTPPNFVSFFSYVFKYFLTRERQKTVDIGSICMLLELILPNYPGQVEMLVYYLKKQSEYKAITLDQWMGIYQFVIEISFPDCGNFNPDDVCPVIIDGFVDWLKTGIIR